MDRVALIHCRGESPCNGVAFYYSGERTGIIAAEKAELVDGKKPNYSDPIICGTCGRHLSLWEVRA